MQIAQDLARLGERSGLHDFETLSLLDRQREPYAEQGLDRYEQDSSSFYEQELLSSIICSRQPEIGTPSPGSPRLSDFAPAHKNIPLYPREVLLSLVETSANELLGYSAGYPVLAWTSMGIRAHVAGRNLAKKVHVKAK